MYLNLEKYLIVWIALSNWEICIHLKNCRNVVTPTQSKRTDLLTHFILLLEMFIMWKWSLIVQNIFIWVHLAEG